MNVSPLHPNIGHLLDTIQSLTGHAVDFDPAAELSHGHEAWEVISDAGVRYGVLRVTTRERESLSEPQRALYTQLSRTIAHEADLRREHSALEHRFRLLDQQNSDLTTLNRSLSDTAYRDPHTGLYRRWYLTEQLRLELARTRRTRRPLSLVMLRVDAFDRVQRQVGVAAADAIVHDVARRVATGLRACDVVARTAGEEFCALLIDTPANGAAEVCARLERRIAEEPFTAGTVELTLTASAGYASSEPPSAGESPETMLERTLQALNRARRARGR